MSLKARIEAVIYAAEEPVTLTQLVTLFAAELPDGTATTAAEAKPGFDVEADTVGTESGNETTVSADGTMTSTLELKTASTPAVESGPQAVDPAETVPAPVAGKTSGDTEAAKLLAAAEEKTKIRRQRDAIYAIVDELKADYAAEGASARGMEIREVAGGFRMSTRPEYHDAVRGFIKSLKPPLKLSLPALETLAVIAYKQPVTAPEIGEIRGVDSGGVLGSLLTRKLIATFGRKQVIGRPILYKTTREFLLRFGLKDVSELPSLEEFERMAAEITSLDEEAPAPQDELAFAAAEDADSSEESSEGTEAVADSTSEDISDPRTPAEDLTAPAGKQPTEAGETDSLAVEVEDSQEQP